jgi:hypothetical protein
MRRIVDALKWACGAAALAFMVLFFTPLVIGGPGAHQAPLLAFILTPIIFVATLLFALVWSRLGLIVIVVSLLYPAWYYVNMPPRSSQASALVPLSEEERTLMRSRHFDARVAVDRGRSYPIYRDNLVSDLRQTGLFSSVNPIEETPSAELIALVTGSYYGGKTGHSFSLRWARRPDRRVNVKMWFYASDGPLLYASRHRLEVERLAREVVRQMDALGPSAAIKSPAQ